MSDKRIENVEVRMAALEKENEKLRKDLTGYSNILGALAKQYNRIEERLVEDEGQLTTCLSGLRKLAEQRVEDLKDKMSPGDTGSIN